MAEEKKNDRFEKGVCILILSILMLFFASILLTVFTRQILVKRMGMKNRFTEIVFFDNPNLNNAGLDPEPLDPMLTAVDWKSLYPVDGQEESAGTTAQKAPGFLARYETLAQQLKVKIYAFTTKHLMGNRRIVELENRYKKMIAWDYASYREYTGIILLPDGLLTGFFQKKNVSVAAENAIGFSEYCHDRGIEFLYVQIPSKISETEDRSISGAVDFSNQNANDLIGKLREADVDVLDLRERIEAEGLDHHALFYRTDHHWRAETGLWAARNILEYCRDEYRFDVDPELLREDRFTRVEYPGVFLGSLGKKTTLAVTEPDDFVLLYPQYETSLHHSVLNGKLENDGDFSVLYDMTLLERVDYYGQNTYLAYLGGDFAQSYIENHLKPNDLKILVINDSFGDCVLPFLSLGVSRLDELDIRIFNGSVKRYMEENTPDLVIVMYYPDSICGDGDGNYDTFDFR